MFSLGLPWLNVEGKLSRFVAKTVTDAKVSCWLIADLPVAVF
jgi:hypothetical protein